MLGVFRRRALAQITSTSHAVDRSTRLLEVARARAVTDRRTDNLDARFGDLHLPPRPEPLPAEATTIERLAALLRPPHPRNNGALAQAARRAYAQYRR